MLKKRIQLVLVVMFLCSIFTLNGCALFDADYSTAGIIIKFQATENNITVKTLGCSQNTFGLKVKTPKDKYHIVVTYEITNNSAFDIDIDVGTNFTAKIGNEVLPEDESVSIKYAYPQNQSNITAGTSYKFNVGYLVNKDWDKFTTIYTPFANTEISFTYYKESFQYTVISNNMQPTVSIGDKVNVRVGNSLCIGDAIVFYNNGVMILSRIVAVDTSGDIPLVSTKGDANIANDSWTLRSDDIIGFCDELFWVEE